MTQPQPGPTLWRPEFEHDACGIGALAHIKGRRSHQMVDDALSVLVNLEHRGGVGLERTTGDGAGILLQVPHRFFRKEAQKEGCLLPDEGDYGVAMLFLPQDEFGVTAARRTFEDGCAAAGLPLLFWREVPVDPHDLGEAARDTMPSIWQAFIGRPDAVAAGDDFERALYVCRRTVEKAAEASSALDGRIFYVCSMSARTVVYKGMLLATQMRRFFLDLNDAAVESALCLVHSRYSTNTTPSWERAHPNRYIIHNGEINTLKGNVCALRAREPGLYSPVMGPDLEKVLPVIDREGSDSAILDNVLEFLVMNGRSMSRAASLLMPEPWDRNDHLDRERRAFDRYQSMLMEPWDGPAAVAYTDGRTLGASLDRNGLRPARYDVTHDDRLLLSSEVGTLDVDPADILVAGSLGPGEMLEVDPAEGRIVWNDELRRDLASAKPFADWIAEETLAVGDLDDPGDPGREPFGGRPFAWSMAALGHSWDDVAEVLRPMAEKGAVPLASMGFDTPLACLSARPRPFFDYFYQLFAQVTNPPIDALRESMVTSSVLYLGNHGNILEDARDNCRLVALDGPILSDDAFRRVAALDRTGFHARTFVGAFDPAAGPDALVASLDALCDVVERAGAAGTNGVVVGNPVRRSVIEGDGARGRASLGIPDDARVLLVFGGSLGAASVNDAMVALKDELLSRPDLHVVHSCGRDGYEATVEGLRLTDGEAARWHVVPYIADMGDMLAAADLVVSRAGASSIAEIAALAVPSVLVPYPHATADHQTTNAQFLVGAKAAVLVRDDELSDPSFQGLLTGLLDDRARLDAMRAAARGLAQDQAAARLADQTEKLGKQGR